MVNFLTLILVFAGVGLYFMSPVERTRLLGLIKTAVLKTKEAITLEEFQAEPFFEALRARVPRAIATLCLVVLGALFARSGIVDLVINAVCLFQIGLILERLVGRAAFVTVYVASAIAAGIVALSLLPEVMSPVASGGVLGSYALLLVTSTWNAMQGSSLAIPLNVMKRLAPVAAIFFLHKLVTGIGAADLAAITCGITGGIVLMRDVSERTPQFRRLATAMTTVVAMATLYGFMVVNQPVDKTVDLRPEIDQVVAVEASTARLYEREVERFRKGRITALALADVIEKSIVPELRRVAARLRSLRNVPPEQQQLVAAAQNFLKLRDESWRLRAAALHKSDMGGLRQAESKELASHQALQQMNSSRPPAS